MDLIVKGEIKLNKEQFEDVKMQIRKEEIDNLHQGFFESEEIIYAISKHYTINSLKNLIRIIIRRKIEIIKEQMDEDENFKFHFDDNKDFDKLQMCLKILEM